ncbi:MAG: hypothetical protein CMJ78_09690 [Planctomycetaceae bacterium]|nr:hypothetical protein [Planctomycetaceae bacterium]
MVTRLLVLGLLCLVVRESLAEEGSRSAELFEQRIMPIFRSSNPSSCIQCHLAAVDLKKYILPSHEKTFLSLRDKGLVDLENPAKSKILTLIRMGEKDRDEGARLIHAANRKAELEAFSAWIEACCNDPKLRSLPKLKASDLAGPERPNEVIRHARKIRLVDSFVRNVWSQRMRCFPCHTPHELDESNARHRTAIQKQKEFRRQYPELVSRLKIFHKTPEETLQYLIDHSKKTPLGDIPMINLKQPQDSLLVLKPMSKLPNKLDDGRFPIPGRTAPLFHLGGLKMHLNDHSYKSFVAWIQDYANVVGDRYESVDDLPADNWVATQYILRLTAAPDSWTVTTPVQIFLHAKNKATGGWQSEPVAFTQGTVTPRHIVNGALFFFGKKGPKAHAVSREVAVEPGEYLIKVYADKTRRLKKDPTAMLTPEDFVGQAPLKVGRWRPGFRQAKSVSGANLIVPKAD